MPDIFSKRHICVVGGAGYVGVITGVGLAELGHQVVNVDVDHERVRMLQAGRSPIYEEGLDVLLRGNLDAGRLRFSTDLGTAVGSAEVVFIAVGTPSHGDGGADLSQVIKASEDLLRFMNSYKVVVIKSTAPVGTVQLIRGIFSREKKVAKGFDIVVNPEFLREGNCLYDFFYPDRIVIGTDSPPAGALVRELYRPIISRQIIWPEGKTSAPPAEPVPVVVTSIASAQMIKYAANTFLATRVSFINEIAGLCEKVGADIREVARGIGYDPRIGHRYLDGGLGFGGPCLEKDLRAVIKVAQDAGCEPALLKAVLERNEQQIREVILKVKKAVGSLLYQKTVAIFGLSFKPGTNDVRNSLALRLIEGLLKEGAIIRAHDPVAVLPANPPESSVHVFEDPYEATVGAEGLVITTPWPQFQELNYNEIRKRMAGPCIVDGWNILDGRKLAQLGFRYVGVGVGSP